MALVQPIQVQKQPEESDLQKFAKILGIAFQLGNMAGGISGAFGADKTSGMVPPAVSQKYGLLSDQDWMNYFGSVPQNRGVGMPTPIIGSK